MTSNALPLSIFAKTFPGNDPLVVLQQVRSAGYDAAQYNMACSGLGSLPTVVSAHEITRLEQAIEATGVEIVALSATYNMGHPDGAIRASGAASLATLAGVASAVGIPVLTVCTGSRNAHDPWAYHADNVSASAWVDMRESMVAALDAVQGTAITIGIEPEPGTIVRSVAAARSLLDELASPQVGVVLDIANLLDLEHLQHPEIQQTLIAIALDVLGDRIVLVHAKDRNAAGEVVPAGEGCVDFDALFRTLEASGVRAPIVTHGLDAAAARLAAATLRASLSRTAHRPRA